MTGTQIERTREVRFGLVLYGGVSLAVYENGVAQEFYRAVRGHGVYELVKTLTDSDIVVDVVSGTSAGGVNGILLGYALANDRDFTSTSRLWREDGDILRLLRSVEEKRPASLLDSEGYYQPRLEAAFRGMGPALASAAASEIEEFDLFITGTDVRGNVYTVFDDQGHATDVKDHRGVFVLSYRGSRKNEFGGDANTEDARHEALGKLARLTSCFPVAFAPVLVEKPQLPSRLTADSLLQRWGKLDREACFLDGGILDNKPFSYTIDTIQSRLADREVERILVYVEPNPQPPQAPAAVVAPNVVQAAVDALVTIPGFESIAGDLKAIAERNRAIKAMEELQELAERAVARTPPGDDCLEWGNEEGLKRLEEECPSRYHLYAGARLKQLRDRALLGILSKKGQLELITDPEQRTAGKKLAKDLENEFNQLDPGSYADLFTAFDVYFRLRRLFQVTREIGGRLYRDEGTGLNDAEREQYTELRKKLNHQIKLLEILRFAMESAVDYQDLPWSNGAGSSRWGDVANALRSVLSADGVVPPVYTGRVKDRENREAFARLLKCRIETPPAAPKGNLLEELDKAEIEILRGYRGLDQNRAVRAYCRFLFLDAGVFPMQLASGINSLQALRTVRLSPLDAKRGVFPNRPLDEKLCGNKLASFSGFLKRSWRSNDLLWGRLDGVCQLLEMTVTPERLRLVVCSGAQLPDFDKMFPHSPQFTKQLREQAVKFGRLTRAAFDAIPKAEFDTFLNLLVAAAQREILAEELPELLTDAVAQQIEWNQYLVPPHEVDKLQAKILNSGEWTTAALAMDPAMGLAVARDAATRAGNGTQQAAAFFDRLQMARERAETHLPPLVQLEILTKIGLLGINSLLGTLGPELSSKVEASALFRYGFRYPLQALHGFVKLQRRAQGLASVVSGAVIAVCLTLLGCGIYKWKLLFGSGSPTPIDAVLFWGLPLSGLIVATLTLSAGRGEVVWFKNWLHSLGYVLGGCALGALVALWAWRPEQLDRFYIGALCSFLIGGIAWQLAPTGTRRLSQSDLRKALEKRVPAECLLRIAVSLGVKTPTLPWDSGKRRQVAKSIVQSTPSLIDITSVVRQHWPAALET